MLRVASRALAVVAVLAAGPAVIAQQTPAPVPPVAVMGEVNHPGSIDWTPQLSAQDAINAAGGLTDRATQTWLVQRRAGTVTSNFTVQPWRILEPGDHITVGRRPFAGAGPRVFVKGAVAAPGAYTLRSPANALAAAVAAAGGLTAEAGDDVQIWSRLGPPRGDHPPIDASTQPDEVSIRHISRSALNSHSTGDIYSDSQAIVVPTRAEMAYGAGRVTVTGDVRKAGEVGVDRLTLRAALVAAGGPTSIDSNISVGITHLNSGSPTPDNGGHESVSYVDIADGSLDLPLRDGDVVKVPSATFTADFGIGSGWPGTQLVQWTVGPRMTGIGALHGAGATAQEMLAGRNAHQDILINGVPSAPLLVSDMTVERPVRDRVEVLSPKPSFVLDVGDFVTVVRRAQNAPATRQNLSDLAGNWIIDWSRRLTLQFQHGRLTGTMTSDAGGTRVVAEAFGDVVVLREDTPAPKRAAPPASALSVVDVVFLGPRGALVGRTDTLHIGVDGLRYLTRDSWNARR